MRFYVLRHGETDFNRDRIMQGYQEVPLNDLGIRQATQLALRLQIEGIERIVCSDLRRTVMTGCIVASYTGVSMEYDPALRERNPGRLTGHSYDEEPRFFTDESYHPPGGEDVATFYGRVRRAFERLVESARHPDERVAIITHGLVCQAFVSAFFGQEHATGVGARNTSLTVADFEGGEWTLVRRDCSSHLAGDVISASLQTGG